MSRYIITHDKSWSVLGCTKIISKEYRSRCRSRSFGFETTCVYWFRNHLNASPQKMLQSSIDQRSHSNSPFGYEPTFVSESVTTKAQALSTLSTGHYRGWKKLNKQDAKSNKAPSKLNPPTALQLGVLELPALVFLIYSCDLVFWFSIPLRIPCQQSPESSNPPARPQTLGSSHPSKLGNRSAHADL